MISKETKGIKKGFVAASIERLAKKRAEQKAKTNSTTAFNEPNIEVSTMANDNLPIEEQAKITWNTSAEIREEFGNFETYLAYSEAVANGQVRITGGNVQKGAA